jgi:phosphatidylinositol-3-phosphatase
MSRRVIARCDNVGNFLINPHRHRARTFEDHAPRFMVRSLFSSVLAARFAEEKMRSALAQSFLRTCFAVLAMSACGCSSADTENASGNEDDLSADKKHRDSGVHDSGTADSGTTDSGTTGDGGGVGAIQTVFVILMENSNWSDIKGNSSAPYINKTLLPMASHAERFGNITHPSEPNYIWLEAGDNLGVDNDDDPSSNHQSTTNHLSTLLDHAGVSWKAYAEGIGGTKCPLSGSGKYATKHVPFVFFDDVTDKNSSSSAKCIQHIRPYTELAGDLTSGHVAHYNFITPDLCHDMHDLFGCDNFDRAKNGDQWLSREVPKILASDAYKKGGAIFLTWDESDGGNSPIGMIVISPFAKGGGYSNTISYNHSSTLRTMQEIFGVRPFIRAAANATDLSDLFRTFP